MELLKIGELARRTGVPIATLKFYLREGLIAPARKTGRTMAWYHPATVDRIRSIRELKERQFLPLDLIRKSLDTTREAEDDHAIAEAITEVLVRRGGKRVRRRAEMIANGADPAQLAWLERAGLAVPDKNGSYTGDDLALLSTLGAARRAGLGADMLPFEILGDYLAALNKLVEVELRMFRAGLGRAKPRRVAELTKVAAELSERLVVLLRRKLLLPTLERIVEERGAARPSRKRRRS